MLHQGTPIWASPLPDLPSAGNTHKQNDDGVYLEPVDMTDTQNFYYSMCQNTEVNSPDNRLRDEDNYDIPTIRRKMSIDPRHPVY